MLLANICTLVVGVLPALLKHHL
jgi:hypothetical protein